MDDPPASPELLAAAQDAAARNRDYYALLGLAPPAAADDDHHDARAAPLTRDEVQRAWRRRSLRFHPDKAGAAFDQAAWEEFGRARDVLASAAARAAYDGARAALRRRQRERGRMDARRRRFAEELERAEGAAAAWEGAEARARRAREEAERGRQAEKGRAYADERRRRLAEAEEREVERLRREDDARDNKIRELEHRIAEKAKRRAEKKAKREGRKSGVEVDDQVEMLPSPPVPAPEPKPVGRKVAPVPAVAVQISDDPIRYWETQWPTTKARLLAAQAKKIGRMQETHAAV